MLKNQKEKTGLVFITFLLFATVAINLNLVEGSGETLVYFDPPEILDLPLSTQFTLALKIVNVTNLYGFDIQFKWDKALLGYISHTVKVPVETYLDGVLHEPFMKLKDIVDEDDAIAGAEPGTMAWIGCSCMFPAESFNGSGIAFEFTFNVTGIGSCWIEVVHSDLANNIPQPISHTVQNAYFSNAPGPTPVNIYMDPPSIVDSTLTPCHNFSVEVNVEDVTALYSFEFWVSYNTTVLNVTQVTVNPSFPPAQTHVEILEDQGKIKVNASLTSPPGISGSPTLATIEFHVTEEGESILDLHNVTLINESEDIILNNEPGDGYFNNMPIMLIIYATIDIHPNALNINMTKGKWINCYIEFPTDYNVSDVKVSTIMINDTIPIDSTAPVEVGDYDNDTVSELKVGFNRTEIIEFINVTYGNVTLALTGSFRKITSFKGSDIIMVSSLVGDVNCDGTVDLYDVTAMALIYKHTEEDPNWNPNADIAPPFGTIDIYDLIMCVDHYGEKQLNN